MVAIPQRLAHCKANSLGRACCALPPHDRCITDVREQARLFVGDVVDYKQGAASSLRLEDFPPAPLSGGVPVGDDCHHRAAPKNAIADLVVETTTRGDVLRIEPVVDGPLAQLVDKCRYRLGVARAGVSREVPLGVADEERHRSGAVFLGRLCWVVYPLDEAQCGRSNLEEQMSLSVRLVEVVKTNEGAAFQLGGQVERSLVYCDRQREVPS